MLFFRFLGRGVLCCFFCFVFSVFFSLGAAKKSYHRGTYEHTKTTFLMEIANLFQQRICVPFFIFSFRRLFFLHFYTQLKKCVCVLDASAKYQVLFVKVLRYINDQP